RTHILSSPLLIKILGSITAAALINSLPGKLAVNCSLHPDISPAQGVVIEGFITAALTLTVLFGELSLVTLIMSPSRPYTDVFIHLFEQLPLKNIVLLPSPPAPLDWFFLPPTYLVSSTQEQLWVYKFCRTILAPSN
ncbi:hypothetical protein VP01_14604g1, partial [Puccinia sorghi]